MAEPRSRGTGGATAHGGSGRRRILLDPARAAALDVLKSVRVDNAYANLVLPAAIAHYGLTGRDAAFATELASGTLRRRGTYDAVLAACVDRPLSKVEAKVLDALRVGCHQLLSMRVPDHAAISTTVDLVHARVSSGAAGFANAVLRKVSAQDLAAWIEAVAPDPTVHPTRHTSVAYSHPTWIVDSLREAVGPPELHALLDADNHAPLVTLAARPGRSDRADLPGRPTPYSPWGAVLDGGDPGAVPEVADGRAAVQDEGSQLVVRALVDAPLEGPDERWLDLCAGPGGKAGLLAAVAAQRRGAAGRQRATARPSRAGPAHAARGARRAGVRPPAWPGVVAADGMHPPYRPGAFDRVLVDAPCSGLGRTAAPAGGPVEQEARRPGDAGAAAAPAADRGPRPGAARRTGALRDLLAGALGDGRRRERGQPGPRRRSSWSTPPLCWPTSPTAPGRSPAPSSCGRTATAPTRCSWPSCVGGREQRGCVGARLAAVRTCGSRAVPSRCDRVREADLSLLADLQPDDYEHDPSAEHFPALTLDQHRRRLAHQDYWRSAGTWSPTSWNLPFVVTIADEVVGVQSLEAEDFLRRRTVDSGSWLVRTARGRGVGQAMRRAVLGLAFDHLDALAAVSSARSDNAASLGVSAALGYVDNGITLHPSDTGRFEMRHVRLTMERWRVSALGADVVVTGLEPCLPWFGLAGQRLTAVTNRYCIHLTVVTVRWMQ